MQEFASLLFAGRPLSDDEFVTAMDELSAVLPPVVTTPQLVALMAAILQTYTDPTDEETMDRIVTAAIDTVMGHELAVQLDLAVGPEDGVN